MNLVRNSVAGPNVLAPKERLLLEQKRLSKRWQSSSSSGSSSMESKKLWTTYLQLQLITTYTATSTVTAVASGPSSMENKKL